MAGSITQFLPPPLLLKTIGKNWTMIFKFIYVEGCAVKTKVKRSLRRARVRCRAVRHRRWKIALRACYLKSYREEGRKTQSVESQAGIVEFKELRVTGG